MTDWKRFYWKWHVEIGLTIVLVLGTMSTSALVLGILSTKSDISHQAKLGVKVYHAACAQRHYYAEQISQTRQYILDHGGELTTTQRQAVEMSLRRLVALHRILGELDC